jgi:hypothetical protein
MNEKAAMNEVECDKYITNIMLPLFAGIENVPGKRVLLKVGSGPGRTNLEMLATLQIIGCYVLPGVPNTSAVTQEMGQNYGPFKRAFRSKIRKLWQACFEMHMTMQITDLLPLLVFGGYWDKISTLFAKYISRDVFAQA